MQRKKPSSLFRAPALYLMLALVGCAGISKSSPPPAAPADEKAQAAAPKPTPKTYPCNPVLVSGITGECAGPGDPAGIVGESFKAGLAEHPIALTESGLPRDRYGLVDWADAIKSEEVKPHHSFNLQDPDVPQIDMDVVIYTKSRFMPDVVFPHKVHTMWLTCTNCHPAIFPMSAKQANQAMTMADIAAGKFCGVCHNRIAFPLEDCNRCHIKPRDVPPIDPDAEKWGIQPVRIPD